MSGERGRLSTLGTAGAFIKRGSCSEALLTVLDRVYGYPLDLEEHASMHFAGGIVQHGYQCGMVWGAALAAGAQAYRVFGPGVQAQTRTVVAAQRLVETFLSLNPDINCLELTDTNWKPSLGLVKYFVMGGPVVCVRRSTRYAPAAYRAINSAFAEDELPPSEPPVSCAALVAEKLGASEMHTVMAAGLAGGIGLSGGGCGALGAALWLLGMKSRREGGGKKISNPLVESAIDRYLKSADHEFECAEIVGRRFEDVGDHARYLREGGCSHIMEALAAA